MTATRKMTLGEVCESIDYGVTASANFNIGAGPKLLRITDLTEIGVDWATVPNCVIRDSDEGGSLLLDGDMVVARTGGTVGKSFLVHNPPRAVNASYLLRLRPRIALVSPEYLSQFLGSSMYWSQLMGAVRGAAQPNVNATTLSAIVLPVPPLAEQQCITAHLAAQIQTIEAVRTAAKSQLSDAMKLVQLILDETFAETIDAEFVKIGEVARTTSGTTPSRGRKDYWDPPKHPWVKTGEVAFNPISQTEELISDRALAECSLSLLPPGTVLIAMYGQGKTRGQSALLEVATTTNQACFAILPNDRLDPEYLQFWLRHSYQALRAQSEARGGNQSNLNGAMLNNFEVPLLPRPRQQAIAKRIRVALAEAEILQRLLSKQLSDIEQMEPHLLSETFNNLNHQAAQHG